MATCSAIVSKSGSILYTENSVNDVISFLSSIEWFVSDDKYCIMDNIAVDGTNN
jgi:hypothetical protein